MSDPKTARNHRLYTERRAQNKVDAVLRHVDELGYAIYYGWHRDEVYSRYRRNNRSRAIRRVTTIRKVLDELVALLSEHMEEP